MVEEWKVEALVPLGLERKVVQNDNKGFENILATKLINI